MNRAYRPDDFEQDRGTVIVAMLVAAVYGVLVGIAGTLIVQWLLA